MFTKNRISALAAIFWLAFALFPPALPGGNAASTSSPYFTKSDCAGNVVLNSGFEQGNTSWTVSSTGAGPKAHNIIGQYLTHDGLYDAQFGGYEGVEDEIKQQVIIPNHARLSYWWQMASYETTFHYDDLSIRLEDNTGNVITYLTSHDPREIRDVWVQDVFDLSDYAGQTVWLDFYAYNDNYYFSTWNVDTICLASAVDQPYLIHLPAVGY